MEFCRYRHGEFLYFNGKTIFLPDLKYVRVQNAQAMALQSSEDFPFVKRRPNDRLTAISPDYTFVIVNIEQPQSNELTRGTSELVPHFRLIGGVHIEARTLLDINLIWFRYIARLFQ